MDKKKAIKGFIEEYYDLNKFEYIIRRKAKSVQNAVRENKTVDLNENTIESLISAWNALIRADKINGAIMRAIIAWDVKMDKKETISVYQKILEKYPHNMEAYFQYWEFLNKIGDVNMLDKVSEAMLNSAQNSNVPTLEWMKAHSLRSKTLIMLSRHQEAIETLKKQVHVIPPLSIPGLSYFKDGEIIVSDIKDNPFVQAYDENSQHSGNEAEGIVIMRRSSSISNLIAAENSSKSDSEQHNKRSAKPVKLNDDSLDMMRFSFNESMSTITYGSSKSSQKLTKKQVKENEHYEIEGFSVSTDVDFLFQIGKIWAESGINVDEGIRSLNDFWLILDYFHQDMDEKIYLKMKTQAKFYIGVCYYRKK